MTIFFCGYADLAPATASGKVNAMRATGEGTVRAMKPSAHDVAMAALVGDRGSEQRAAFDREVERLIANNKQLLAAEATQRTEAGGTDGGAHGRGTRKLSSPAEWED